MAWMGLTSDEQVVLISCSILIVFIIISYPITLKLLQKEGPHILQIGSCPPALVRTRLTERLKKFREGFKYIKVILVLYMVFAFILFLYFIANDIHGPWMFFIMISGSVVFFPLVLNTAIIKAMETTLKHIE